LNPVAGDYQTHQSGDWTDLNTWERYDGSNWINPAPAYPVYNNSDPTINPDQQSTNTFFTIFNKYTMELRYPFSTNPSSTIYGLAFFEAANGWYDFKDYNPFRLRRSTGVGMRFFLPMFGLLGFDYGIGIDRLGPNVKLKDASRFTFMLGYEPE
jgi:outer membrane protein insertion porin family